MSIRFLSILFLLLTSATCPTPLLAAHASKAASGTLMGDYSAGTTNAMPAWKIRAAIAIGKFSNAIAKLLPGAKDDRNKDATKTDGLAIASLCCALGGFLVGGPLAFICAIVFGAIALGRIERTGQRGQGLALAGVIVGALGLVAFTLIILAALGAL